MAEEQSGIKPLSPAFAVAPWPRTRGGPQVLVRRFISNARLRRYRIGPSWTMPERQPQLLNIGHPHQERMLESPGRLVYRVAGMFLEGHFHRLEAAFQDRTFRPEFKTANQRIQNALQRADFVIYQSLFSKNNLDTLHQRPAGSWAIIPNAVPLRFFIPETNWSGRHTAVPVIGTVGTMRYRSRLEVFFDVARRLPVKPRLLLVGEMDEYCQKCLWKAQEDPYWQGAIQHIPSVKPEKLVQYYRQMDCLLHTVAADSCPNVVVEALACGVPVVCPREGGSVELVGNAGIAIDDPGGIYGETLRTGMAEALQQILDDLPNFRQRARTRAEQNSDLEALSAKYLQALGFPPFGPERGWKYATVRTIGQLLNPITRRQHWKNNRPRIGLVLWDWNLGGIASWMFRVAKALPEFKFYFIATHLAAHAPHCREVGEFVFTPGFTDLVVFLRRKRIDLLQVANNRWPVDAARAAGVAHIIERTDGTRSCCSLSKGDLDQVIVSAAGTRPYIQQFWPGVPTQVIHNAVDLAEVDRTPAQRLIPADQVVLGRCSRFGSGKRLDLLISATTILLERGWPVVLILAGEDSRLPGAVAVIDQLKALAAPLGDRVRFVGKTDTPLALAKGFDIGICTSDPFNEGIPNSLIEPMACGKPVVATDVDQVSELVINGKNGFLVKPGDTTALAAALERLLADAELRQRLGVAARRTIEERFSFTTATSAYRTLYQRLLDHG